VAMVARFKLKNAAAKDQVEHLIHAARGKQNEDQEVMYRNTLVMMDRAEEEYAEDVVIDAMVPEDVQVYRATGDEIRTAVEDIVHEEMEDEGVPLSQHDLDLLARQHMDLWKDRPISGPRDPNVLTGAVVGALGVYGRIMRKPPIPWRWLALSVIPIYCTTAAWCLGFGKVPSEASPDDWWAYQVAGMEVRTSIARSIALSRARRLLQESPHSHGDASLGSSTGDERIQLLLTQAVPDTANLDSSDPKANP